MAADTPSSSTSGDVTAPSVEVAAYTTLHLSAVSFLYPPNLPDIQRCACKARSPPEPIPDQSKLIRVYHTEPSVYAYNQGSYLVKETRFSTEQGWHAPSDDLVADDALFGSPVASFGWWRGGGQDETKIWETKVYYIDNSGKLRERTNWSHFSPEVKEAFELPLPDPGSLVPPVPGWKLTPLRDAASTDANAFPDITPLATTKLAAVRSEDKKFHVFYQASDNSIREIVHVPGTGWVTEQPAVAAAEKAKAGTPLTAITGGWAEVRVFYVGTTDMLSGAYADDHVTWEPADIPSFTIPQTALLSAVGWNYASPYFEMRIYSTDDKDELYEISYSRSSGGWAPLLHSVSITTNPGAFSTPGRNGTPLSAVAAVIVDDSWVTKVYFHPRRIIGEWDLCTKVATYNGIPKYSQGAFERRQVEEETRVKIREDEERKAREEAERQAREEAERLAREEAERKAKEEEEARKASELPNTVTLTNPIALVGSLQGAAQQVDDRYYKLESVFPITVYGYSSSSLYITDNGMICLDRGTDARGRRLGERLPYRDQIPDYSIFPYWTDLLIVAGKPHGVYYEFTGEAPNRVLVVEWYVTRYSQEDQYFHFNVRFEEAKPGIIEFKYYDAVDKGAECTIGVQGPSAFLQFSHNEAKVFPGLKVTLDTNSQTLNKSTFEI
ncbi:hypothetical protein S7711_02317 [Stachybotrys chartarum IBT 7711]|uniref:Uncharacterized protein n=1 Tax=Stachybotrys chartarum (strain CBS 109288 / IBT 7711) TaxID=1280523 RepID=A0A084B0X7_STACB|nr:hypothetical protein S7711_02317 [Stachybotrys chartarum IBT 7711]KFA71161.1 hypothetical protein S40288_04696 [Stachybotrys chartarum IBT 40288]